MRNISWCALLLALPSSLAFAQTPDTLPKLVNHAHYVLVTTYAGDDLTNPQMMPDDRQAVLDVQNAIKSWGRYALAYNQKDADLILLVRKGHVVESLPGVHVGVGSTTPANIGANVPTNMGDSRDMLALYDASYGLDAAPLWRNSQKGGLAGPDVPLVQQLRKRVEASAK
jgi:hypothetical protein